MCKFHKDVARDIATDPVTGEFNAGRYSVALVAMAKFRIEQYMPAMYACDGFVPALMRTDEAVQALDQAGIKKSLADVQAYRDSHIDAMRAAMDETARNFDLSLKGLNVPDMITKDGYQHCAKMKPDPTQNGPFLDEAVVELFEGYDDVEKTWARQALHVTSVAHKPEFEAIRAATEHFLSQPDVTPVLKAMFENSLVKIFETARLDENDPGLETDGCVMCGHGSRAAPPKPSFLSTAFSKCATCTGSSISASLLSHLTTCVLPGVVLGGAGGAAMAAHMMTWMIPASPVLSACLTAAKDRFVSGRVSMFNMAASALLAIPVAWGVQHLLMDNNAHDRPDTHNMHMTQELSDICGQPFLNTALNLPAWGGFNHD